MRRRLSRKDDHEDTHRWLVSYADFITLLFAFFVVMYSISQVNEGKYKVLSDAMVDAFREHPHASLKEMIMPSTSGDISNTGTPPDPGLVPGPNAKSDNVIEADRVSGSEQEEISLPKNAPASAEEKREFTQVFQRLQQSLQSLIKSGAVEVRANEDWIEVDMKSAVIFESGSDVLSAAAQPLLRELAQQMKDNQHLMRVRGYTDNLAINTERFPSNWELSSARAVAVVRMLQQFQLEPHRMAVESYGEYSPVADNGDEAGRARNRRVVLAISRFHSGEPGGTTEIRSNTDAAAPQQVPSAGANNSGNE